jgi:hypothetical protein
MCLCLTPRCQANTVGTPDISIVGQLSHAYGRDCILVEACKHDCDTDVLD